MPVSFLTRAVIALVALAVGAILVSVPVGAQAEGNATATVRGEEIPLDGRPLPPDLTDEERRAVFEAALSTPVPPPPAAALTAGEGPDWLPVTGTVELWCTQSNPGYGGCSGHHDRPALDIGLAVGTPILAAGPGLVVTAEYGGGGQGNHVVIAHPDGTSSHYLHLSAIEVLPGAVVERGRQIGLSGSTGSSTAPHLHYEERGPDGQPTPIGPMLGRVDDTVVSYPQGPFGIDWPVVPYGTMLRNDGYLPPQANDRDGDGTPDRADGDLAALVSTLGIRAAVETA